jgi:hypothetical protein
VLEYRWFNESILMACHDWYGVSLRAWSRRSSIRRYASMCMSVTVSVSVTLF